ncbi:MAG: glycosyltransferase family 2 protein [Pseudomonadota bacterium]
MSDGPHDKPALSVVTPAFRETDNLPVLYEKLVEVCDATGMSWEWIIVDDHSPDDTYQAIRALSLRDSRVRGLRLARNCGSHTALGCGLYWARGDAVVALAGDLQDPPETIPTLLAEWRDGAQVVWAARAEREGERASTLLAAGVYYWIMRSVVGLRDIPSTGADFMLLDRAVVDAFNEFKETTVSVLALITWLGFEQRTIEYTKVARLHGRSGWSFRKRVQLLMDSVTSFSYAPIRWISYAGVLLSLVGFLYASVVVVNAFMGSPVPGWTSLMVVVLVIGGVQMLMIGALGFYVWRALDEARARPRFVVEKSTFDARTVR